MILFINWCSLYFADSNASLPEGINTVDVAALAKCYLASLPEPLATFELSKEIRGARSSIRVMRNILKKLPTVNYMTLELITALLLRVSQKSLLNKAGCISIPLCLCLCVCVSLCACMVVCFAGCSVHSVLVVLICILFYYLWWGGGCDPIRHLVRICDLDHAERTSRKGLPGEIG